MHPTDIVNKVTHPNVFADALRRAEADDKRVTRQARRTFADMAPGESRQPVLTLAPNVHFLPTTTPVGQDDSCPLCGFWSCDGTNCSFGAPATSRGGLRSVA
ncbi:hypothetical protein [Streptomyces cinereoruber]|uniref:hypothetical protein n=1 Tax=Streptomyces cinereoruber TaxID=67260 RepID=UPI0036281A7B